MSTQMKYATEQYTDEQTKGIYPRAIILLRKQRKYINAQTKENKTR
jgi:hypothetical protein